MTWRIGPLISVIIICSLTIHSGCKSASFKGTGKAAKDEPVPTQPPFQRQPVSPPQGNLPPIPIVPVLPPNAVTKGSFTVWADPANPQPRKNYNIHIRVTLPSNITTFQKTNVSGTLIGTDNYQQQFPELFDRFSKNGNIAEYVIRVPGAESLVKDTIQVSSPILNENQTLIVNFQ